MTDLRKAAEMALDALEFAASEIYNEHNDDVIADAIKAIRQALALSDNPLDIADRAYFAGKQAGIEETLAQPEQQPVAWMYVNEDGEVGGIEYGVPTVEAPYITLLYTAPPSKQEPVFDITTAVDAAMVEMKNMHPPMRRSECERLIKAALHTAPPSKPDVNQELVEALKYYAHESDYEGRIVNDGGGYFDQMGFEILDDKGQTARAALAKHKEQA